MKSPALAVVLAVVGCASIPPHGPAGHVILDEEHAVAVAYWKPGEDDVQALERDLAYLFAWPDRRLSGMERAKLSDYVLRYHGTVEDGRRVIVGEGEHISQKSLAKLQEESSQPGLIILRAFGGGANYFVVIYDPATRKVLHAVGNAAL